jgi:hypothetical protein
LQGGKKESIEVIFTSERECSAFLTDNSNSWDRGVQETQRIFWKWKITIDTSEIARHSMHAKRMLSVFRLVADQHYFHCVVDSVACFVLDFLSNDQENRNNKFHREHWYKHDDHTGYYHKSECATTQQEAVNEHLKDFTNKRTSFTRIAD